MTLAQSTIVTRIRNWLGDTPYEGYLTADPSTNATVSVNDGTKWAAGAVLEFDETPWDLALVYSVATNDLSTKRGHNGTTATAHATTSLPVRRDPRFLATNILQAVEDTIRELYPYAWAIGSKTITPNTTTKWFNGDSTMLDPIDVTQRYGSSGEFVGFFGAKGTRRPVVIENVPTALCASGKGVAFPYGFFDPTNSIIVRFRALITTTVAAGSYTDLSDGLLGDAICYGATAKLVAAKDISRTGQQTRVGDATVAPGSTLRDAFWYEQQKTRLLTNYRRTLEAQGSTPMARW